LLKVKIVVLACFLILALGLGPSAKASQFGKATFTYGVLWGSLEFPDEAHPEENVTCNLTIGAYDNVIYNFTLEISSLVGQSWVALGKEQRTMNSLAENTNFTSSLVFKLPQNTSGKLRYFIEASTDRSFGNMTFYATNVQAITYEELTDAYNTLLSNYTTLQANYTELWTNYTVLEHALNTLQADYDAKIAAYNLLNSSYESLASSYESLAENYTSLKSNYDSLHDQSAYLEEKYDATTGELTIVRYLMYALGLTTAILAVTTVYFRKKAPYILLRKETTSKTDSE